MQLSARQKKILTWVGYPLLSLITFLLAVAYTFPYDRLRDKIIEVASSKYDVKIAEMRSTLLPGGFVMEGVSLSPRPDRPDEVPPVLFFDTITADVSLLGLLTKSLDLDVEAETPQGTLEASVQYDKNELVAYAKTENFPLGSLPGVSSAAGIPMSGGLDAELNLRLPGNKFKDAEGSFEFKCSACSVGDGETKVTPRYTEEQIARYKRMGRWEQQKAMMDQGVVVPRISLGVAQGKVDIKKGVGTLQGVQAVSPDGELYLDGRIDFADPLAKSSFPACVKWKLADELKKREKDFANVEFLFADKKDDTGYISFPMEGTFAALRWKTKKKCSDMGEKPVPRISRTSPTNNRVPATDAKVRRATSRDVDEPELDGPGGSGPTLGGAPITRKAIDAGATESRDRPDPVEPRRDEVNDNNGSDDYVRGDDGESEDDNRGDDRGDDGDDSNDNGDSDERAND